MPETTITERVTEDREHTVRVCDSCLEREYDPENGIAVNRHDSGPPSMLYFCSRCVTEFRENSTGESESVLRKREWLDEQEGFDPTVLANQVMGMATAIVAVSLLTVPFPNAALVLVAFQCTLLMLILASLHALKNP